MKTLIVAANQQGVIGRANQLIWHLPEDLRRFKALTHGKVIIMGKNTWLSLKRPLPNRHHIVISRTPEQLPAPQLPNAQTTWQAVNSLQAAYHLADKINPGGETMVIGGAQIYQQSLQDVDKILLTVVDWAVTGDAFLPEELKILASGQHHPNWQMSAKSCHHQVALKLKDGCHQGALDYCFVDFVRP